MDRFENQTSLRESPEEKQEMDRFENPVDYQLYGDNEDNAEEHFLEVCFPKEVDSCLLDLSVKIQISIPTTRIVTEFTTKRLEQQRTLYENSKKHGDITVKIVSEESESCNAQEPPTKRRRNNRRKA